MLSRIIKRIASTIVLLFGLVTIVFIIMHVAPGDPVAAIVSPRVPPAVAAELRSQFGIDRPVMVQYGHWLKNALTGELGVSFVHQSPVTEVIGNFLPNTA